MNTLTKKVWVYPERNYEDFGAIRWKVEWEEVNPEALKYAQADDSYEIDPDSDLVRYRRYYKTQAAAQREARLWFKKRSDWLAFGTFFIQQQSVGWYVEEDGIAEWQDVGEPECIE